MTHAGGSNTECERGKPWGALMPLKVTDPTSQLPALRPTDLDVLEMLRADRDGDAVGVPAADIASAAGTRWPDGVVRRLCRHRYVIGLMDDRYSLGHHEPTGVAGAPDAGRPSAPEGNAPGAPATPVAPRLFDLPVYRAAAA